MSRLHARHSARPASTEMALVAHGGHDSALAPINATGLPRARPRMKQLRLMRSARRRSDSNLLSAAGERRPRFCLRARRAGKERIASRHVTALPAPAGTLKGFPRRRLGEDAPSLGHVNRRRRWRRSGTPANSCVGPEDGAPPSARSGVIHEAAQGRGLAPAPVAAERAVILPRQHRGHAMAGRGLLP